MAVWQSFAEYGAKELDGAEIHRPREVLDVVRLFIGLQLPQAVRDRLSGLVYPLPRVRWVARDNLHLTLRFIGEVDGAAAADIDEALARIAAPSFELTIAGVGEFNSRGRVRTLWAGVERSEPQRILYAKIKRALQRAGQSPERRRFSPHVTLARLRDVKLAEVAPFIAAHANLNLKPIRVVRFVMFSSTLGHAGPVYTVEREYPLRDEDSAKLAVEWGADDTLN